MNPFLPELPMVVVFSHREEPYYDSSAPWHPAFSVGQGVLSARPQAFKEDTD